MLLSELKDKLNDLLPCDSAIEGDKIGLQVQSGRNEVFSILIALELNDDVIVEAVDCGIDCILCFHPLIYKPLQVVSESDRVGRLTTKLIQNSIACIVAHTNFDVYSEGTSKILADMLGLPVSSTLIPDAKYTGRGMGVVCELSEPMNAEDLIAKVSEVCMAPVRYNLGRTNSIRKVAIVGGSGTSFMNEALASGAEAFITADVTYHTFHAATGEIMLIDPGHYEMEQFVPRGMEKLLKMNLEENIKIYVSKVNTNPVEFYPSKGFKKMQTNYLYIQNQTV